LGGSPVTEVTDFPDANLLRYACGPSVRVQVRPSGTEPKVKLYAEVVDGDPEPYLEDLERLLLSLGP
jgi:phosphomannomutase